MRTDHLGGNPLPCTSIACCPPLPPSSSPINPTRSSAPGPMSPPSDSPYGPRDRYRRERVVEALLSRTDRKYKVLDLVIGGTDVSSAGKNGDA